MSEQQLRVYVPTLESKIRGTIVSGSGIVGTIEAPPGEGGRVVLDFEGNLYRASNIKTFADRVMIAAGRHVTRYPTVARIYARLSDVVCVGYWEEISGRVLPNENCEAYLPEWLGMRGGIPAHELMAHGSKWGR